MPNDMFGAAGGVQQGIVSQRELALTTLAKGEALMQPDQLANIQAEASLHRAQAGIAEMQLTGEREMAGNLAKMGSGQLDAHGIAAAYARSGLFKQAREWENTASLMDSRIATANAANARGDLAKYNVEKQKLAHVSSVFASVKSADDFDAAKQLLLPTIDPAERDSFMKMQYSPKLVDMLTKQAISADKQLDLSIKERNLARENVSTNSLISYRQSRLAQFDASGERQERRTTAFEKIAGGKADAPPPASVSNDLAQRVIQSYPDMDVKVAKMHADDIFAIAKKIRSKNPGLDQKTALGQAFTAYQKQGGFGQAKLSALGETPDSAAVPPRFGSYKDKTWYKNAQGQVAFYMNGKLYSQQELLQLGEDDDSADDDEEPE